MDARRNLDYLRAGGKVVVNEVRIPSMTVLTGEEDYPDDVIETIRSLVPDVISFDATAIAEELGNPRAANVILLGALVAAMDLNDIDWEEIIRKNIKPQFVELNLKAFEKGKELS